jgi:hypothetical protein
MAVSVRQHSPGVHAYGVSTWWFHEGHADLVEALSHMGDSSRRQRLN